MSRRSLLVLVLVVAGGCGAGFGHVRPGTGRSVTAGGGGGGSCARYEGPKHIYDTNGTRCVEWEPGPSTPSETYQADSNNLLPFGVVGGIRAGYAWAKIGDTSVSGSTIDYYFELIVRVKSISLGLEMGYTKHNLPDDVSFSGIPIGLRAMIPFGADSVYAGIQQFYGVDLGSAVGDGAKRFQLGFMHPVALSKVQVLARIEGQYTSASDLDYSAFGAVGTALFGF